MPNQPKKIKIHGHTVYYDKDTEKAVKYLKYDHGKYILIRR